MKRVNRVIKLLGIFTFALISTGCMKFETTMEVNKDKSMNLTMIAAMDQSFLEQMTETTNREDLESSGFYVEDYNEDGKKGYKLTKQIKNIDDVSTEGSISEEDMAEALYGTGDSKYIFTVKKGFFKNTYKAKFDFTTSGLGDDIDDEDYEEYDETCLDSRMEHGYSTECGSDPVPNQEANRQMYDAMIAAEKAEAEEYSDEIEKFQNMYNGMDLKFKLKIPYKAIKSNATHKSNHGKTLEWDLTKDPVVEFEFPIYDMTKIYIAIGIGILLIMFFTATMFSKRKRKPKPKVLDETNIGETRGFISQMEEGNANMNNQNQNEIGVTPTEEIQQGNKFIAYEEVVNQQPIESTPTINEIYDNIPVVGTVEPQVAPQPIVPDVTPVQPVVEPQVAPQPIVPDVAPVQPVVEPQVTPQPVMPEQPVIDLGIPDMIPTPSDNNQ